MSKPVTEMKLRLRQAMEIRNIKAVELVEKTKIPKSALSQYLNGRIKPKQDRITLLAEALNVDEVWLLGFDVPMNKLNKNIKKITKTGVKIPVLGYVAAGIPIEEITEILDYEEIEESLANTGDFFALKIKGDSMQPQICDGDVVVIRSQSDVENGTVAIVSIENNEATCKKVLKNENGIQLVSFNTNYNPMFYTAKEVNTLPVTILGKVVEMRRKFS